MSNLVQVRRTGPVFEGLAEAEAVRLRMAIQDELAREAENRVQAKLDEVLKHPTGFYASNVHTDRTLSTNISNTNAVDSTVVVTDTPVVYGPWLEGLGSRNYPATSFKGYHTFRLVSQSLRQDQMAIAEGVLQTGGFIERMNGV